MPTETQDQLAELDRLRQRVAELERRLASVEREIQMDSPPPPAVLALAAQLRPLRQNPPPKR